MTRRVKPTTGPSAGGRCNSFLASVAGVFMAAACFGADLTVSGNYTVAAGGESYDNVTVTATATISGGTLAIADGGTITVSAGTASFTCPITMGTTSAGMVTIAPAAGATADFTGKISGPADIDIHAAANNGIVKFTSSDSDYDGNLTLTQGAFRAKGDGAFGSTNGTSTFISLIKNEAYVNFDGFSTDTGTKDDPFDSGDDTGDEDYLLFIRAAARGMACGLVLLVMPYADVALRNIYHRFLGGRFFFGFHISPRKYKKLLQGTQRLLLFL